MRPYPADGQAQKHVAVNEILRRLDAVEQLSVVPTSITAQPASPGDWSADNDGSRGGYRYVAWNEVSAPTAGSFM